MDRARRWNEANSRRLSSALLDDFKTSPAPAQLFQPFFMEFQPVELPWKLSWILDLGMLIPGLPKLDRLGINFKLNQGSAQSKTRPKAGTETGTRSHDPALEFPPGKLGSGRESERLPRGSAAQFPDIPGGTSPRPAIHSRFSLENGSSGSTNGCALFPPGILVLQNFLGNERRGKTWEVPGIFSEGKT